jgi:hypothetical protein
MRKKTFEPPSAPAVVVQRRVGTNGTVAFLKDALGIYITPLHVIEAIEGKKPFDAKLLLANPPWSTVRPNLKLFMQNRTWLKLSPQHIPP